MATLYFNDTADVGGGEDSDWANPDNWWTDAECTTQASGLPTSADSVVRVTGSSGGWVNTGTEPTVVNLTGFYQLDMDITVTGLASGELVKSGRTLTGDAVLLWVGSAYDATGAVTGLLTVTEQAFDYSHGGDMILTGSAEGLQLLVGGDLTLQDSAYLTSDGASVSGDMFFYDQSYNAADYVDENDLPICSVGGTAYFYDDSGISEGGKLNGVAVFNDNSSAMSYVITGDVTFNDNATSFGNGSTVGGSATFNDYASNSSGVTITGDVTFNDSSSTDGNVTATNLIANAYATITASATATMVFNDHSHCALSGGSIIESITFNDQSTCDGYVGEAGRSIYGSPVVFAGEQSLSDTSLTFVRRSGINGSSILGVA